MKKVINGKLYNTDTAECIAVFDNGLVDDTIHFIVEELYRKRTGEFFICGHGGAATVYAEQRGYDGWVGSEKIIPLTYEAAQKWAEEHLSGEKYEDIFGEIPEDESHAIFTVSISTAAIERAKREAAKAGMTISAYIESLIQ